MKRGLGGAFFLALLIILGAVFSVSAQFQVGSASDETVRVLVRVPSGTTSTELAARITADAPQQSGGLGILSTSRSSDVTVRHTLSGWVALELPASEAARLSKIYHVEEDKKVYALLETSVPLVNGSLVWGQFSNAFGNITGKNVTIAVIDTGINYTHADLGGCLGTTCKVAGGYDYVNSDADPVDDHGHGTHCAGIAAANGTLKGVAPDATLIAYKTLGAGGTGSSSDTIAALENASAAGYDIISLSLGGPGYSNDAVSQAVDAAVRNGSIVIVAAGNSGPGGITACKNDFDGTKFSICSPGTARLGLTVGNTDKSDVMSSTSSRGPGLTTLEIKPEMTAPGESIVSTKLGGDNESRNGTSQSTPHVAGAAALLKQLHPTWTVEQVKAALIGTAIDLGFNVSDQGAGRLDAYAAVNASFVAPISILNLRSHYNPLLNASTVFNLTELSNRAYDVSLSVSLRKSAGGSANVALNASLVPLPALGSTDIELYFTGLTNATSGIYSGLITANSSDTTITIPFWVEFNGECGAFDHDTTLDRDMTSNGTCFAVVSDGVTLDGNGYTILSNGSGTGVEVSGFNNLVIRNFAGINNFSDGIVATSMANSIIYNNTITCANTSQSDGMYITTSPGLNITSNIVTSDGASGNGVYLISSNGAYMDSNTVTSTGSNNWGVIFQGSSNGVFTGNTVTTTGSNGDGIYLLTVTNTTATSNTVLTVGSSATAFYFDDASNSVLSGNVILTSGQSSQGVYIDAGSHNNTLTEDQVNATDAPEFYVEDGSTGNLFTRALFLGEVNFTSHLFRAVTVDVNTTPPPDAASKGNLSDYLTITNLNAGSYIDFNLSYADTDIVSVDESTILLYQYSGSSWSHVATSSVDTLSNTVSSGNVTSFSLFAPLGDIPVECGVVDSDTTLTQNLTSNGTCFTINASNIILDGNGYTITGNGSESGIYNDVGYDNITIKNFAGINNFTNGIYACGMNDSVIFNNTITVVNISSAIGVFFDHSVSTTNNNNLSSNSITVSGNSSQGIYHGEGGTSTYSDNIISATGTNSTGICFNSVNFNTLDGNIVLVSGTDAYGIEVNWDNHTFTDDQVNSSDSYEFYLHSGGYQLTNVIISGEVNLTMLVTAVALDTNPSPPADPSGKQNISDYLSIVNLSALEVLGPMEFNLNYLDNDISGFLEETLVLYWFNGSAGNWESVSASSLNTVGNTLSSGILPTLGLFAPMGGDSIPPSFSDAVNVTPLSFNALAQLNMMVRWTDEFTVTEAIIEVNRSGTLTNYSASNTSTTWNLTLADFPAGTHAWRSHANDSSGNENTTPWYFFTISKAAPTLSLTLDGNAANSTISFNQSIWLNGSLTTGDAGTELALYLDGTLLNQSITVANYTLFSTPGTFNISLNYTETQNYSSAMVSFFVIVTDLAPPEYSDPYNETPTTFNANAQLLFNVTWQDASLSTVLFEMNRSGVLANYTPSNVSATTWNLTLMDFPVDTHAWRSSANDTSGNSNTTPWYFFTISRASPEINLTLDGSASNITVNEYALVLLNGSLVTGDLGTALVLSMDSSIIITSGTSPANLTNFTTQGEYNISLYYPTTQNYTNSNVSYWVNVNDSHPPFVESHSPSGSFNYNDVTLSATTNENSTCRYSQTQNTNYSGMGGRLTGNFTAHTMPLNDLPNDDYIYYVRCNNTAGIVSGEDYTITFTVNVNTTTPPSSGGGGGGGIVTGASTATTESKRITSASVQKGIDMTISSTEIPMRKLRVELLAGVTNVEISVTSQADLPDAVSTPPRNPGGSDRDVYGYLEIDHENLAHNIKSAVIDFRVNRSWIEEQGYTRGDVLLMRHTGRSWEELPTLEKKLTNNYVYYNATTKKFSVFAISVVAEEAPPEPESETEPEVPVEPGITPPTGGVTEEPTGPDETSLKIPPYVMLIIGVVVLGFVGMIGVGFVKHRRELSAAKGKVEKKKDGIDPMLRAYISKCRRQGLSEHKIWEMLTKEGWKLEQIEKALKKRRVANQHEVKLRLYIKRARRRGNLDTLIRKELIDSGWDRKMVDAELKRGKKRKKKPDLELEIDEDAPDEKSSDE